MWKAGIAILLAGTVTFSAGMEIIPEKAEEETLNGEWTEVQGDSYGALTYKITEDGVITGVVGSVEELEIHSSEIYNSVTYDKRNVYEIGASAFANYSKLKRLSFDTNILHTIQSSAFRYTGLEGEIIFPNSLRDIQTGAFNHCSNLERIVLPSNLEHLGESAFGYCDNLNHVQIPQSLQQAEAPFTQSGALSDISFEEGAGKVIDHLFENCTGLNQLTIQDGLEEIGSSSFQNCSNLSQVSLPNGMKKIGSQAFANCDALTKITIPQTVTEISSDTFSNSNNVTIYADKYSAATLYAIEQDMPIHILDGSYPAFENQQLNHSGCYYRINKNEHGVLTLDLCYEFNPSSQPDSPRELTIFLPDQVHFLEETLKINEQPTNDFLIDGNQVTFNVHNLKGELSFQLDATGCNTFRSYCLLAPSSENPAQEILEVILDDTEAERKPIQTLTLDPAAMSMDLHTSAQLVVSYSPFDTTDSKKITWSSSNPEIVKVENGTITALQFGQAEITAQMGNLKATCQITVGRPLEGITLSVQNLGLNVGDSKQLIVSYYPENTTDAKSINWSSSNPEVVSVQEGTITALHAGNAVIKAIVGQFEATCNITVAESEPVYPTDGVDGFIVRLYQNVLGRTPDDGGWAYWRTLLTTRQKSGSDVAFGFIFSKEYISKRPASHDFIRVLYTTLLNRQPNINEITYWQQQISQGMSYYGIFSGFSNSVEFRGLCQQFGIDAGNYISPEVVDQNPPVTAFVVRMYTICLDRNFDSIGLYDWTNRLINQGEKGKNIVRGFFLSQEFLAKQHSNEEYVTLLYRTIFNRMPDEIGFQDWCHRLADGYSREKVLDGFLYSSEFSELCQHYGILS